MNCVLARIFCLNHYILSISFCVQNPYVFVFIKFLIEIDKNRKMFVFVFHDWIFWLLKPCICFMLSNLLWFWKRRKKKKILTFSKKIYGYKGMMMSNVTSLALFLTNFFWKCKKLNRFFTVWTCFPTFLLSIC